MMILQHYRAQARQGRLKLMNMDVRNKEYWESMEHGKRRIVHWILLDSAVLGWDFGKSLSAILQAIQGLPGQTLHCLLEPVMRYNGYSRIEVLRSLTPAQLEPYAWEYSEAWDVYRDIADDLFIYDTPLDPLLHYMVLRYIGAPSVPNLEQALQDTLDKHQATPGELANILKIQNIQAIELPPMPDHESVSAPAPKGQTPPVASSDGSLPNKLRETADKVEELQALTRWLSETNMEALEPAMKEIGFSLKPL